METTKRLVYIDVLRGFTIILVVLIHTLQKFYTDDAILIRIVSSFYMPLFMFISGFVSYKLNSWDKIRQRSVQLLIPFFSAILLSWLIEGNNGWSLESLINKILYVIKQPDKGLWFLWALFFINVIFLLCRKIAKAVHIHEIAVTVIVGALMNLVELLTGFRLFGYHWIAWYFLFFAFGVYLRSFNTLLERPKIEKIITIVALISFPVFVAFFRMHNEPPTFYKWINLGGLFIVLYRLLVAVMGVVFFYEIFKRIVSNRWNNNFLCKFGKETLPIYYMHFYVLHYFFMVELNIYKPLHIAIIVCAALIISYAISLLCKKTKITRLLVLGENVFKK